MGKDDFVYYPKDMDKDMIPLCDALNALPGVRTFFCCSGHGRGEDGAFYILLGCRSARSLKRIVAGFNGRGRWRSDVRKPYRIDLDCEFWPLKKPEIGVRISNWCIDHLKYPRRKREFDRVIRCLEATK